MLDRYDNVKNEFFISISTFLLFSSLPFFGRIILVWNGNSLNIVILTLLGSLILNKYLKTYFILSFLPFPVVLWLLSFEKIKINLNSKKKGWSSKCWKREWSENKIFVLHFRLKKETVVSFLLQEFNYFDLLFSCDCSNG